MNKRVLLRRRMNDDGLTLPELLISIVILSIVIGALALVFVASIKHNQTTQDRLGQSHDAQVVANYIVQDAQSVSGTGVLTSAKCGATGSVKVTLNWTAPSGTVKNVTYAQTGSTLTRWACDGAATDPNPRVVSHNLAATNGVTVSCTGGSATCGPGSTATGINVVVQEDPLTANAFNYSLNAAFRTSLGTPTPHVPDLSALALIVLGDGSGTTTPCLDFGGSSSISITVTGAAGLNCYGSETGAAQVNGTYYSTNTCATCATDANTHWYSGSAPISDPYAARAYPNPYAGFAAGTDANGDVNCDGVTLPAGKYRNITLNNNKTCTLASGTFVVTGCINANNGSTLKNTGGVLISFTGASPCSDGSVLMVGNSSTSLQLPALSSDPTWPEFSMIMPRTSTATVSFQGQAGTCVGGLYFPKGTLNLGGGSGARFGRLVVAKIANNGNVSYNIGGTCP